MKTRELKFRAWNGNIMFYDDLTVVSPVDIGLNKLLERAGKTYRLMQFTGLYDKNNKEIYEGDIFQDEEDGYCDYVEWDDTYSGWTTHKWFLPNEFMNLEKMEIIGNIYENPELLHGK